MACHCYRSSSVNCDQSQSFPGSLRSWQNGKPGFEVFNKLNAAEGASKESNTVIACIEALNVKLVTVARMCWNWRITIENFDGSVDLPETVCQVRASYILRRSVTGAA
ncbi:hypothetical protein DPV78_012496 [Talaromyces pinophilus]|nr:hypothetical protein DPV78_012496 [Talaromyces pinophilus]